MKTHNYSKWYIFASLLVLLIIPLISILSSNNIQSFVDFSISNARSSLQAIYAWDSTNYGGNAAMQIWRIPYSIYFSILRGLFGTYNGIGQYVLLLLFHGMGFFGCYKLLRLLFSKLDLNPNTVILCLSSLFFIFNTYTLIQLSNSYLLVLPYLMLPIQGYLLLQALESKKILRYAVSLALINSLTFGINLIFDVIAIIFLLLLGYWYLFILHKDSKSKFIEFGLLSAILTFLLTAFWLIPFLYSSLIDKNTATYVLQSESFYNLDSSVVNVFRGLGEWSFFSGNDGIPYYKFASTYKDNLLVILSGYVLTVLALIPALYLKRIKRRHARLSILYFTVVFILSFLIIGGTNQSWPTAGLFSWAFAHIPYLMAFRNTYKFASLEMISLSILLVVALVALSQKLQKRQRAKPWLGVLFVGVFSLIILNANPYFNKTLFSTKAQVKNIPDYWFKMAGYINKDLVVSDKLLLLPNQYFDVFQWPSGQNGFPRNLEETLFKPATVHNGCKGCGQYYTSNFIDYVYGNISKRNLFPLLGLSGISHVLQRNDYDFKYYGVQDPSTIKNLLNKNPGVKLEKTIGKLDLYKLPGASVYPEVYSPTNLVGTSQIDEITDVAGQSKDSKQKTAVYLFNQLGASDKTTPANANVYRRIFDVSNVHASGSTVTEKVGVPQAGQYNLSAIEATQTIIGSYTVSYSYSGGNYTVILKRLDNNVSINSKHIQFNDDTNAIVTIPLGSLGNRSIVIDLANMAYVLKPINGTAKLGTIQISKTANNLVVYDTKSKNNKNLLNNGSFENGLWQSAVQDCQKRQAQATISMKLVSGDATDGTKALQLSSRQDSACTTSPALDSFMPGLYLYSFDSKSIAGGKPAACVWDGTGCVAYSQIDNSNSVLGTNDWQKYTNVTKLDNTATNFFLYFYARRGNYSQTITQYDNVQVYRLDQPLKTVSFNVSPSGQSTNTTTLESGVQTFAAQVIENPINLMENGSFESGPWQQQVSDCSGPGDLSKLSMQRIQTNTTDKYGLELSSQSDLACISSDSINEFSKDNLYKLSIKYRVLKGQDAHICVWDGSQCLLDKHYPRVDDQWHSVEEIIQPKDNSQAFSIYLYAGGEKVENKVDYTDIKFNAIENNFTNTYILSNANHKAIEPMTNLSFAEVNPTKYSVKATISNQSLLVFQQSFHPGWKAYIVPVGASDSFFGTLARWLGFSKQYEIPDKNHIVVNSFENGWWIDNSVLPQSISSTDNHYKIDLEYLPQRLVYYGIAVGGLTLVGSLSYLAYCLYRRRYKNEPKYKVGR